MFSGILPQNSGTVTISFWKQSNRSIKKKYIFDSFSLKEQNVLYDIRNICACPCVETDFSETQSFQTKASSVEAIKATHGGSGGSVGRGMAWIPQSLNLRQKWPVFPLVISSGALQCCSFWLESPLSEK